MYGEGLGSVLHVLNFRTAAARVAARIRRELGVEVHLERSCSVGLFINAV